VFANTNKDWRRNMYSANGNRAFMVILAAGAVLTVTTTVLLGPTFISLVVLVFSVAGSVTLGKIVESRLEAREEDNLRDKIQSLWNDSLPRPPSSDDSD
jgi:hypothetical protein